jgi:membrane protein YqaA with SNARE-associated domain
MMLLDEPTLGSSKTFVRRVCTKLQMNRYSSTVFWLPWMAIIPSNWLTVLSGLGQYALITESAVRNDGFLRKMLIFSRMK